MLQNILECPTLHSRICQVKFKTISTYLWLWKLRRNVNKFTGNAKKTQHKIYLIPATIPEMYYIPEFLDISHVAVAILLSDKRLL